MKNAMRFFLSTLLIFVVFSCAQLNDEEFGSVSFSADNILKSVARAGEGNNLDNVVLTISIQLSGATNEEISRDILLRDIGSNNTVFSFERIPIGKPLDISIQVKSKNYYKTLLYSGSTSIEFIRPGQNRVSLGLDSDIRFLLWNENKEMPSSSNFRLYDGINQNSLIGDKSNMLIDFTFDKYSNLYTLECIDRIDTKEFFVNKYSYAAPDVTLNLYHEVISNAGGEHLTYSCLAVNNGTVYIGANDYGASEPNYRHIKRVTGKNTSEIVIPKDEIGILCPEQIEFDDKGNLYVLVRGAYCPIYKFAKEGQTFVKKIDGESILGVGNPYNFKISDIQIQGNYLYAAVFRQMPISGGGPEKAFGGGVIPVDISTNSFGVKSISGFDKDGKNAVLEKEAVTNNYFYHPVKFITRDDSKLYVADDGFYTLSKPGYKNVIRNVNRVVTLSLSNPAAPAIESCVNAKEIMFRQDELEETLKFIDRYILWGADSFTENSFAIVNSIKSDLNIVDIVHHSGIRPAEVMEAISGTLIDFHIDKNYNIFAIVKMNTTIDINLYDYETGQIKKMIKAFAVDSVTMSVIASDGEYVYVDNGTKVDRYSIVNPDSDTGFNLDIGTDYSRITALEFDKAGNLYIGAGKPNNTFDILKYEKGSYSSASKIVSLVSNPEKSSFRIADLQVIGDKLYVIRRYVLSNPADGSISSGELDILWTNNLTSVRSSVGLKPNFSTEPVFPSGPLPTTEYFYGPRNFIALKPDEIVIADDGIDDNGREANSVVTYSLDGVFKNRVLLNSIDFGSSMSGSEYIE